MHQSIVTGADMHLRSLTKPFALCSASWRSVSWLSSVLWLICVALTADAFAQTDQAPSHPLDQLRTLNDYFPLDPPETLEQWEVRREQLRRHVQVSLGLWPLPEKGPLNAVIHSSIDMGQYTIEKVYFESFPGFFVTGNLYRPKDVDGKCPAVLSPHGHFRDGRFHQQSDEEVRVALESGAEQFESNARNKLLARCANLAIMGCVVFHYDMLGYADSQQISSGLAHGFREQREHMNGKDAWGLFSPRAELRLQSVMGLQTWNSIRSLDFLCSLPEVDSTRIGVTGASGGGTQTFILCAVDSRPAAAFPAVMVSTAMQGGCTCENCSNLRIHAGNVDFAALFAPKPIALTSADDWTREMETRGMPELKAIYQLYAESGQVVAMPELTARTEFPHNFNQVSREAMYRFFNRHLAMGMDDPVEVEIQSPGPQELSVFDGDNPAPPWSDEHEAQLLRYWEASSEPFDESSVNDLAGYERFQSLMQGAIESIVSHPESPVEFVVTETRADGRTKYGNLHAAGAGLAGAGLSTQFSLSESRGRESNKILLRINSERRDLPAGIRRTLETAEEEYHAMGALTLAAEPAVNRLVNNGRVAAGYTFGYNRSLAAWKASQILYAVQYLAESYPDCDITIAAGPAVAPVAVIAYCASAPESVSGLICDPGKFRFADVSSFEDPNFLPGAVKYGDIEGLLSARASGHLHLFADSVDEFRLLKKAAYLAGGNLIVETR